MSADNLTDMLRATGAILDGHFILASGRHSDRYIQCALLLAHTPYAAAAGALLAAKLPADLDLVVSPAMGGIIIGHEVARARELPFLFTERVEGRMALRRGFSIPGGARVAIVEDVVTTGGSLLEVAGLVRAAGAELAAAAAIVDRAGDAPPDFGAPFHSLVTLKVRTWDPAECPLCAKGLPAEKPGSGHLTGKGGR
jgi:orotate phosphoribosyltransferase